MNHTKVSPCMPSTGPAEAPADTPAAEQTRPLSETAFPPSSPSRATSPMEIFANALLFRWMTVDQLIKEADVNQSGEIELDEFKDLCIKCLNLECSEGQLTSVFREFDADNSGTCSAQEMRIGIDAAYRTMEIRHVSASVPCDEGDMRSDTKLVALVAHNNMKPSMMTFVAQHRDFFKQLQLTTTRSTGSALEKKLNLRIAHKVASGPLGGDQQLGGMITAHTVAAVFFFIDPLSSHPHEADIRALSRICEVHNIASATNPTSGDALVYGFENSPRRRRLLLKDQRNPDSDVVATYKSNQQEVVQKIAA